VQAENFSHLKAKRNSRVRVSAADEQDDAMDERAGVKQVGQRKSTVACNKQRCNDKYREHFHDPRGAVIGVPARPSQKADQ